MRLKFNFCKIKIALSITMLGCFINGFAQTTDEFIGNGNTSGVTVSTSDDISEDGAINTLNGLSDPIDEATIVRLFQQTRMAYDYDDVQNFSANSVEEYIDQQMAMPLDGMVTEYEQLVSFAASVGVPSLRIQQDEYISFAFYNKALNDSDQLRLKAGFALSQIMVTSFNSDGTDRSADRMCDYFDVLYNNAFGNFRDILQGMTYHVAMGRFLSYIDNKKADPERGTFPDENFAREIMQLFTIGLFELNRDGSHKLDENGNSIPTYDNDDIVEMAKVFTGLENGGNHRMIMVEEDHDTGEKIMIDGSILPANRPGDEDISDVLDILFNHSNTGPFIATRLIKQLVKSNPTPAYIQRVTDVFNNSAGIRGDMGAVFKAILLDREARDCTSIENRSSGKLLQPIERFLFVLKALNIETPSGRFHIRDFQTWNNQRVLGSPSVFNFFSPFYAEPVTVAPRGLVSPEFQIFDSVSAIEYYNNMELIIKEDEPFPNRTRGGDDRTAFRINDADIATYDLSFEEALYEAEGAEALIDHYNLLLCRNQLSEEIKEIILNAITDLEQEVNGYSSRDAVTDVALFIATSPEFGVLN